MAWTPSGDGNYLLTYSHRLIPNRFSHLVVNLFWGAEDRDSVHVRLLPVYRWEGRVWRSTPKLIRKPLKSCQLLNLDQQKAKAAGTHLARGILYCVLEIPRVGEEAMPRDGWYFSFMPTLLLKTVCFSLQLKIPKGKRSRLPSLLCVLPSTVWVVNKCHITFIPLWLRMMFSKESCSLKFLSKSPKLQTFPRKGALLKASIPCLNLFPRFHPCVTHLFPGLLDFPPPSPVPHLFYSFPMSPAAFIGKLVTPHFTSLPS